MVVLNMQINAFCKKTFSRFYMMMRLLLVGILVAVAPAAQAATAPVLMVFGDSLVAGHGLPQDQAFPDILARKLAADGHLVTVLNAGVSGDTTAGGLARLAWSLDANPDAMIIVLGGNDLLRGLEPQASFENLDAMIRQLKDRGVRVLLAGMQAPRNLGADYADAFDKIYPTLASQHAIAFYPFFLDGVALQVDLNQPDGMHPNAAGVDVIAQRMLPSVKQLLAGLGE